jgi:CYTH domain-containing protein
LINLGDGLVAEIDEFLDTNEYVVEVEFKDKEQMNNFTVPAWFGKEIKGKTSYSVKVFKFINNNKKSNLLYELNKIITDIN